MRLLIETSNRVDSGEELNFSFLQVGEEEAATKFLGLLDDKLKQAGAKHDIVDTKTIKQMEDRPLSEFLLEAVQD